MKQNIMLDLETLGNRPGAMIMSVGAVKFGGGTITDEFYQRVDAKSCTALGLVMDTDTVLWWMRQKDEARAELNKPGNPLMQVLVDLMGWMHGDEVLLWGNGASFDNVLLGSAYDACRLPRPWKYYNDRCFRTIKALHPQLPMERQGTHHNALEDAKAQALHLINLGYA
jgi:hypothetical protein